VRYGIREKELENRKERAGTREKKAKCRKQKVESKSSR
jgi:hypothetical protein